MFQSINNKIEKLDDFLRTDENAYCNVAYIGDDINDLSCMIPVKEAGGLIGCPADASKDVKKIADFISEKDGGDGAVREFIEWVVDKEIKKAKLPLHRGIDVDADFDYKKTNRYF